ncbi:MAG TPA: hypothetical protein PLB89_08835 [Flavobacteriales bacterium]|nr:hypothetical protein [Flavobacteriales bacterium]
MNPFANCCAVVLVGFSLTCAAQKEGRLPDVSSTLKGTLILPVPLGNPLFESATESVGQVDGVVQFPIYKGLGLGVGGKMTWFSINERALAPFVTSGEIRRSAFYGKVQYEAFTGERTFYEVSARLGSSTYTFDCPTCGEDNKRSSFHWGFGTGYYLQATDNLAFGLTLGYETDDARFSASDLGLESFPGKTETTEARNHQYLIIGMGFSTRFRKAPDSGRGW